MIALDTPRSRPATSQGSATLSVRNLSTHIVTRAGTIKAVNDVSFDVAAGEVLGLVGESGSGKSMTGFSIMGLLDEPCRLVGGSVLFKGRELVGLRDRDMRRVRGRDVAMVFQDPMMTLNPVLRVDTQIIEAITAHERVSPKAARDRAIAALEQVGIPAAKERLLAYPHQLSGGMRQRVSIAIALLHRPALLIADEPTTALDVTIQGQILYEVQSLCRKMGTALVWITHDLSVIAGLADRVCVMYAGQIVESGPVDEMLDRPCHPYTGGLIGSVPSRNMRGVPLAQIPGQVPALFNPPQGCLFRNRCARADNMCLQMPPLEKVRNGVLARCFHPLPEEGR